MPSGQQGQGDHGGSRPDGDRPSALSRTTETPERPDQHAIPALERDRRKRDRDRRQRVQLRRSVLPQRGRTWIHWPSPFEISASQLSVLIVGRARWFRLRRRRPNAYKTAMLLASVEYARPRSLDEALSLLAANPNARALAGGQTLVNVMKARIAAPELLVDLNDVPELRGIRETDDGLELGAMVTYTQLARAEEVHRERPILADVAAQIADVQVRNRGTVGGNVCSNDPTNHLPPVLVAVGATMAIAGASGIRLVPAEEFFLGVYLTAVGAGELLTGISVPRRQGGDGFASVTIGADGTCIANAAASVNGNVRVVLGCVAATPVVVEAPSADEEAVREAVAGAELDPPSDIHAPAEYRRQLAAVLAARAVRQASEEAA